MAEQIKFEMDSDEVLGILQESIAAESKLGKECWKTGLKEDAMKKVDEEASMVSRCHSKPVLFGVKPRTPMFVTSLPKPN